VERKSDRLPLFPRKSRRFSYELLLSVLSHRKVVVTQWSPALLTNSTCTSRLRKHDPAERLLACVWTIGNAAHVSNATVGNGLTVRKPRLQTRQ
jgi:hypothetical protein